MQEITLVKLKELSIKVEEWISRYDIEKSVYEDLCKEHQEISKFIEENPGHFQSKKEHTEAICTNSYIIICLMARIGEY
jgi:hypothetical protein